MDIHFNLFDDDFWENYRKTFDLSTYINPILSEIKITVPELKFNIPEPKIVNFKANLFSEKLLEQFREITNFPKKDIWEMNYALRYSNINFASSSTFTEPVDSSHPIDNPKENRYSDELKRIMNNHIFTPSKELVNASSKTIFVETIADFVLRLAHQDPVNTSIYIWVLFFSYFGYLISKDSDDIED